MIVVIQQLAFLRFTKFLSGCDYLIGATRTDYQTFYYGYYECMICKGDIDWYEILHEDRCYCQWPEDAAYYMYRVTEVSVPVVISTPSNGLLTTDTEIGMPGCTTTYPAMHANHEELKNHQSVTILLNDIFRGDKYDIRDQYFFKVDPK